MLSRRALLALAAAPGLAAPRLDLSRIPRRKVGKVKTRFDSPGPKPNGLQATEEGLWIMDQGNDRVYLVDYESGKVLRDFDTEADKASGITAADDSLWLASTYSREVIQCDSRTGATIVKRFTPGAGVIYRMAGDAAGRSSPLAKPAKPARPPAQQAKSQPPKPIPSGTGAHGLEWRAGKLWVAVPPSRTVYCMDPVGWVVESSFPTAGNRPHGIGWEGRYLWVTDSNLNAFYKHDPDTGAIVEMIQLADSDPLPHGMTIRQGELWYCDDVGIVCSLKM